MDDVAGDGLCMGSAVLKSATNIQTRLRAKLPIDKEINNKEIESGKELLVLAARCLQRNEKAKVSECLFEKQ